MSLPNMACRGESFSKQLETITNLYDYDPEGVVVR